MQRNTAIAVGLLVALCAALVFAMSRQGTRTQSHAAVAGSASARTLGSALPSASVAAAAPSAAEPTPSGDVPPSEGFDTLPDGRKVPPLPASAPKRVGFGVVVVAYQGAQAAPTEARSREEAKRRAEGLLTDAKHDFAAAVAKGDRGSTADAGHVPRDVLEPAVEYLLFTLQKGDVCAEPIDTPRGYWIVRRND
jgi:hypothetical protein